MKIVGVREAEDCFERSAIRVIFLDAPLDEAAALRLAACGDLDYHPEFPRPFFRVRSGEGWHVKGVVGAPSFRLFFTSPPEPADVTRVAERLSGLLDGLRDA